MNIFGRFSVLICKGFICLINKLFPPRARAVKRLAEIERNPKEALRKLEEEAPVEMRPGILAGTEGLIRLTKTVEVELGISRYIGSPISRLLSSKKNLPFAKQ
jgi:hypothetical protein